MSPGTAERGPVDPVDDVSLDSFIASFWRFVLADLHANHRPTWCWLSTASFTHWATLTLLVTDPDELRRRLVAAAGAPLPGHWQQGGGRI